MRLLDLLCRSSRKNESDDPFACLAVGFLTGNIDGFEPGFYVLDSKKDVRDRSSPVICSNKWRRFAWIRDG